MSGVRGGLMSVCLMREREYKSYIQNDHTALQYTQYRKQDARRRRASRATASRARRVGSLMKHPGGAAHHHRREEEDWHPLSGRDAARKPERRLAGSSLLSLPTPITHHTSPLWSPARHRLVDDLERPIRVIVLPADFARRPIKERALLTQLRRLLPHHPHGRVGR